MPTDIANISTTDLLQDLVDIIEDIRVCRTALSIDIQTYGEGNSVAKRLEVNQKIKMKIEAELAVRQIPVQVIVI